MTNEYKEGDIVCINFSYYYISGINPNFATLSLCNIWGIFTSDAKVKRMKIEKLAKLAPKIVTKEERDSELKNSVLKSIETEAFLVLDELSYLEGREILTKAQVDAIKELKKMFRYD